MKILGVQNFALMMMATVTVMVYPAPLSPPDLKKLLHQIKHEANNNEKHVPLDKQVTRTPRNDKLCETQFFCWAEKILNETETHLPENHSLNKLTRTLHMYNEKVKNVICPLDANEDYALGSFLEDIKTCVDYALAKMRRTT